jgi:hypothetical protein
MAASERLTQGVHTVTLWAAPERFKSPYIFKKGSLMMRHNILKIATATAVLATLGTFRVRAGQVR